MVEVKTLLIVVLGFVGGFAGRGIFETLDAPWWGSILVYAPLFAGTFWVSRRLDRKAKPERWPFEKELADHLKRNDYSLITNEQLSQFKLGIHETPYAPRGQMIFAHPDTIAKITREAGPEMIRAFQEWGTRHRDAHSPFLATCAHEWPLQVSPPGTRVEASWAHEEPHRCTNGALTHGPKCVCRCGATAAYVEKSDGTIDKTFEGPA